MAPFGHNVALPVPMPKDLVSYVRSESKGTDVHNTCSYAFVVDKSKFSFKTKYLYSPNSLLI